MGSDTTFGAGRVDALAAVEFVQVAEVSITKIGSPDPVLAGGDLTYTLTVTNSSPTTSTGVVLTDTLPVGVTFVSSTPGPPACTESAGTVTCNIGDLAGNASTTVTIEVAVDPSTAGVITNTAAVTGNETDPDTSNNTKSASTSVTPAADLTVTKIDSPDPVLAGTNLVYAVTVTNGGPSTSTGAVLTDTLPAGVTFVSSTPGSPTCTLSTGTVTCSLGDLAANASTTVTIHVGVNGATTGTLTNTASVAGDEVDPDTGNNSTSAATLVNPAADLAVAKIDSPDPVLAATNLVYAVTVTNSGPSTSTGAVLTDTLPAGVTFVSSTPGSPTCTLSTGTVTCSLGDLAANASSTVTIEVGVNSTSAGKITNTASVAGDEVDPDTGNNSTSAATLVNPAADLAVAKIDSPDPVLAGTNLVYAVTVTNSGPSTSTGVVLTDTLPIGVTFVSSTPPSCADSVGTVTCDLGALGSGETTTVAIEVAVGPSTRGTLGNTATVSSNETDPNTTDNSDTATTTVSAKVDLSVSKADSPDPAIAGTVLSYVVTITNTGPSDATGVTVIDVLPAGASYVSATPEQGGCTGTTTITCSLSGLAANASTTVAIQVGVNSSTTGTMTNAASVVGNEQDSNGANNTTTALTTVNAEADLSVTKQGPTGQAISGTSMSYVLTVTNSGPSDATGVTFTDTLPEGVTYATSSLGSPACVESTGTVTCGLGVIAAGETASFSILVNVGSSTTGFITNTVSVTSGVTDPDQSDNTATEVTLARIHPDLPSLAQWGLVAMTVMLALTIVWLRRRPRGASRSTVDPGG